MYLRQKITDILSPFNSKRLLLMVFILLMVALLAIIVYFFFFGKNKNGNNFDTTTLCLLEGPSNGTVIFIDQTAGITPKQAAGINRRIKKIATNQVEQFGLVTFYNLTRNNRTELIGFVCNPGRVEDIKDGWVDKMDMSKKQIFKYYKLRLDDLTNTATKEMINKPDSAESKMMAGVRDAIVLYKNPATPSPDDQTAPKTNLKINLETDLDWLIIFSDMKEHRPDFSLRTATTKTTPTILYFWTKNASLKLDLNNTTVGIYYFKDKKNKNARKKTNRKFKRFWHDYWQSQGATVEWFRSMK